VNTPQGPSVPAVRKMGQINLDPKDLDKQLKLEQVNACFAPSTSEWSRRIHANLAAENAEEFASIRFGALSQDLTETVQTKDSVTFAEGAGEDERRVSLVQGAAKAVRFLASMLLDYNQVHGTSGDQGKIVVECVGDSLEKLVGTEADFTRPRVVTLHYFTSSQFPTYLEKYCEGTAQTAQLSQLRQLVPAAYAALQKDAGANRITPMVLVYKHKQDGEDSFGFTTSAVPALTEDARESSDVMKEILDDAGLRNCQMMQVDLTSGNVMAFDADARRFKHTAITTKSALPAIGENSTQGSTGKSKLLCQGCAELKDKSCYSKAQLKAKAKARCSECVASNTTAPGATQEKSVQGDDILRQTQAFIAEFSPVIQLFAAAKSAATGKGAVFIFSRSPPADLLCVNKQSCRHPELSKLHLCTHGNADRQFVVAWGSWIEQVGLLSARQLTVNMKDSTKALNDTLSRCKIDASFPLVICSDPSGEMFPPEIAPAVREPLRKTAETTAVLSVSCKYVDYQAMSRAGDQLAQNNIVDLNMDRNN